MSTSKPSGTHPLAVLTLYTYAHPGSGSAIGHPGSSPPIPRFGILSGPAWRSRPLTRPDGMGAGCAAREGGAGRWGTGTVRAASPST